VDDFIEKILELDPSTCWITDWSSLGEFIFKTQEEYNQKSPRSTASMSRHRERQPLEILQRISESQESA
jgi:hypothetical protein